MKKIYRQMIIRILVPIFLILVGAGVIVIMIVTQPEGENHPAFINILGIAGFFIPMILAVILLVKLWNKVIIIEMLARELKELKRHKDYYYGAINCNDEVNYIKSIAESLKKAHYTDLSNEVDLHYDNYKFFLRKHFWTLDSFNIHFHMATMPADIFKIKDYFNSVSQRELTLNYGKYKGSRCGIVAVCAVKNFEEDEKFMNYFHEQVFARGIAVVKVIIDAAANKIYVSRGGTITGNRGKRVVAKFILKTKSLKKCRGEFEKNKERISELEKKFAELSFGDIFSDITLTDAQRAYADTLSDDNVGFLENPVDAETDEKSGMVFYKKDGRILYLYCDYDENENTFGIIGIDAMEWNMPSKKKIRRKERNEIKSKIIIYFKENNIPYDIIEMVFSNENQTMLMTRHK